MFSDLYLSSVVKTKQLDPNTLKVHVPELTNLYDPKQELLGDPAPFLFRKQRGDFQVSLKVSGKFSHARDQAGILIQVNKKHYLRCGVEVSEKTINVFDSMTKSNEKFITTCIVSDDDDICDSSRVPFGKSKSGSKITYWFRVKRRGSTLMAYCSDDGEVYRPIRVLTFSDNSSFSVGIYGACPMGNGLKVEFSDFEVKETGGSANSSTHSLRAEEEEEEYNRRANSMGSMGSMYGYNSPHAAPVSPSRRARSVSNREDEDDFSIVDSESEHEDRRTLYCSDDEDDYYFTSSRNLSSSSACRPMQAA